MNNPRTDLLSLLRAANDLVDTFDEWQLAILLDKAREIARPEQLEEVRVYRERMLEIGGGV